MKGSKDHCWGKAISNDVVQKRLTDVFGKPGDSTDDLFSWVVLTVLNVPSAYLITFVDSFRKAGLQGAFGARGCCWQPDSSRDLFFMEIKASDALLVYFFLQLRRLLAPF